jgi:hypothetical protein
VLDQSSIDFAGGHVVVVQTKIKRYIRPYAEAKENMLDRARRGLFEFTEFDVVAAALDRLDTLDHDTWASVFMDVARPHEERAQAAEARGDLDAARQEYLRAYAYYPSVVTVR